MDPPLAKAKANPISNSGSASVIAYLRRGKRLLGERVKGWRKMEEEEEEEEGKGRRRKKKSYIEERSGM